MIRRLSTQSPNFTADLKALLAQSGPQPRAQQIIVFSQQHAHVQVPARAGRAQSGCKRDKGSGSGLVLA